MVSRRSSADAAAPLPASSLRRAYSVQTSFGVVTVELDSTKQHTISWKDALTHGSMVVPEASCNLYKFPVVTLIQASVNLNTHDANGAWHTFALNSFELSDGELALIRELIIALAVLPPGVGNVKPPSAVPDAAGAFLIHALLVANTDASVTLALDIFRRRPELISQVHVAGPFAGETSMHVLAVNCRHDTLDELLVLASQSLTDVELREVLLKQRAPATAGRRRP